MVKVDAHKQATEAPALFDINNRPQPRVFYVEIVTEGTANDSKIADSTTHSLAKQSQHLLFLTAVR